MKLRSIVLQMKDVVEQRKLEQCIGDPNIAASQIIGGEFRLSEHTIAVLKEMQSVKQQIASTLEECK